MAVSRNEAERIARLEVRQDHTDQLSSRLVDSQDTIARSLQELVAIHKEAVARQEADRETLSRHEREIGAIWGSHRKLHKVVWFYVWTGGGVFGVLAFAWKAGALPALLGLPT